MKWSRQYRRRSSLKSSINNLILRPFSSRTNSLTLNKGGYDTRRWLWSFANHSFQNLHIQGIAAQPTERFSEAIFDKAVAHRLAKPDSVIWRSIPDTLVNYEPKDYQIVAVSFSKANRNDRATCVVATKVLPQGHSLHAVPLLLR